MEKTRNGKWIWYPDDFEIELSASFMAKRFERDVFIPPFWKQYSCYRNVKFCKEVELAQAETIFVQTEGQFNLELDGKYVYRFNGSMQIPAGKHRLVVSVYNAHGLPALKIDGEHYATDESWQVTCNDHAYKAAAFNDVLIYGENTPNNVHLPVRQLAPVAVYEKDGKTVYDFGKELFAFLSFEGVETQQDLLGIFYGESEEEALCESECELIDEIAVSSGKARTGNAKAFRYITTDATNISSVIAEAEYLPLARQASFTCSDERLNEIYKTSLYTLSLTVREFIIDGIKRDRWVWSGDAYQGYLMNYYSFHDRDVVKRTMTALFGREPFDMHLNHIMDYTFYWIIGFFDYYEFTGDRAFVEKNLSKAVSALEYCISRTNANGLMEGYPEDWVFIDWAEGLDNRGEVSFEQMLYVISLQKTVALLEEFDMGVEAEKYRALYKDVSAKLEKFWDEEKGAYIHSFKDGKSDGKVLRYANMFAILYDLCDEARQKRITETVLKSDNVQQLTTPYMRFYEMAALMKRGEKQLVLDTVNAYWGGMLEEGATSFWETYDAAQKGMEKYAMYGRKFGKSLCHAWGASPVYLIGRYVVGLQPQGNRFTVEPDLSGLRHFTAQIPLSEGSVSVSMDEMGVEVYSDAVDGTLIYKGERYEVHAGEKVRVNA